MKFFAMLYFLGFVMHHLTFLNIFELLDMQFDKINSDMLLF